MERRKRKPLSALDLNCLGKEKRRKNSSSLSASTSQSSTIPIYDDDEFAFLEKEGRDNPSTKNEAETKPSDLRETLMSESKRKTPRISNCQGLESQAPTFIRHEPSNTLRTETVAGVDEVARLRHGTELNRRRQILWRKYLGSKHAKQGILDTADCTSTGDKLRATIVSRIQQLPTSTNNGPCLDTQLQKKKIDKESKPCVTKVSEKQVANAANRMSIYSLESCQEGNLPIPNFVSLSRKNIKNNAPAMENITEKQMLNGKSPFETKNASPKSALIFGSNKKLSKVLSSETGQAGNILRCSPSLSKTPKSSLQRSKTLSLPKSRQRVKSDNFILSLRQTKSMPFTKSPFTQSATEKYVPDDKEAYDALMKKPDASGEFFLQNPSGCTWDHETKHLKIPRESCIEVNILPCDCSVDNSVLTDDTGLNTQQEGHNASNKSCFRKNSTNDKRPDSMDDTPPEEKVPEVRIPSCSRPRKARNSTSEYYVLEKSVCKLQCSEESKESVSPLTQEGRIDMPDTVDAKDTSSIITNPVHTGVPVTTPTEKIIGFLPSIKKWNSYRSAKATTPFLNSDPQGTRRMNIKKKVSNIVASSIACKSATQVFASLKIDQSMERSRTVTTKRHLLWHSPVNTTTPHFETFQLMTKEVKGIDFHGKDGISQASPSNVKLHNGTSESQRYQRSFLGETKQFSICGKTDLLDSQNMDKYRINCNKRSESQFCAATFSYTCKKKVHNDAELTLWTADHARQGQNNAMFGTNAEPIFTLNGKVYQHPPLPPGWTLRVSSSKNRPYYVHPNFGVTWFAPLPLPCLKGGVKGSHCLTSMCDSGVEDQQYKYKTPVKSLEPEGAVTRSIVEDASNTDSCCYQMSAGAKNLSVYSSHSYDCHTFTQEAFIESFSQTSTSSNDSQLRADLTTPDERNKGVYSVGRLEATELILKHCSVRYEDEINIKQSSQHNLNRAPIFSDLQIPKPIYESGGYANAIWSQTPNKSSISNCESENANLVQSNNDEADADKTVYQKNTVKREGDEADAIVGRIISLEATDDRSREASVASKDIRSPHIRSDGEDSLPKHDVDMYQFVATENEIDTDFSEFGDVATPVHSLCTDSISLSNSHDEKAIECQISPIVHNSSKSTGSNSPEKNETYSQAYIITDEKGKVPLKHSMNLSQMSNGTESMTSEDMTINSAQCFSVNSVRLRFGYETKRARTPVVPLCSLQFTRQANMTPWKLHSDIGSRK